MQNGSRLTPLAAPLVAVIWTLSLATYGKSLSPVAEIPAGEVDAIVQEALRAWQVPGAAVAVVRGDEVIYLKGHGVRELGKPDPVTPETDSCGQRVALRESEYVTIA